MNHWGLGTVSFNTPYHYFQTNPQMGRMPAILISDEAVTNLEKGPHINVEDFRIGKGASATKIAIPFEGDLNTVQAILKFLNQ